MSLRQKVGISAIDLCHGHFTASRGVAAAQLLEVEFHPGDGGSVTIPLDSLGATSIDEFDL